MAAALNLFALGAIAMAALVAGLFFFRFWRETRDRLFMFFGLAFLIEATNRVGLALSPEPREADLVVYVIRLLSFLLIFIGIVDKNRAKSNR